ncbi:hypothetical protein SAY87_013953 [Trapa incisa]|uniref:6,7-dimethyl-8-ribityllumazine synthase n=1 Tax=Trapa incisa TaxID=236973 RepID=A0AAN7KKA6_9MYRT|nr:hypothetical protein SAY87_013953 [Trapa incisa]
MGNSLRCCLACVLPCGALDLIRIVHMNGHVEEITGRVTAYEVLKVNPNHILSKPTSEGLVRRIDIISPESELKRGSIYFLIPSTATTLPKGDKADNKLLQSTTPTGSSTTVDIKRSLKLDDNSHISSFSEVDVAVLKKISKSKSSSPSSRRERRRTRSGRVDVWLPHLQSISED